MALITKKEAGEILGRSERTINDWIQNGVLRTHTVKQAQYIDSDTVYALKDTEADISHALEERQKFFEGLKAELKELRQWEHYESEPVRWAVKDFAEALGVLCDREKYVFFEVLDGTTYDAIGNELYLTRERVRQIFYKASRRLRDAMKSYRRMLNETIELRHLRNEIDEKDKELKRLRKALNIPEPKPNEEMYKLLCTPLEQMGLSIRALNCLKAADIETMGDLVQYTGTDLLKFRNFGRKSYMELDELLYKHGLAWGSNIHELLNL